MNNPHKEKTRTRIGDGRRLIVEPTLGFHGFLVENFIGCFLIPVVWLLGIGIRNALGIYPIRRLLVLRIINFGGRIDWGREILEKVATLLAFAID